MKSSHPSLRSRTSDSAARPFRFTFYLLVLFLITLRSFGQDNDYPVPMSEFVVFSGAGGPGTSPVASPGYGVQVSSSSNISGGSIGSHKLVKSTGNFTITGNIYSKGTISLVNGNQITGRLAALNSPAVGGTIVSIGTNANIGGNIDANGNIVVSGGAVSGMVTHPPGTTYVGPQPGQGNVEGDPALPIFPDLPLIAPFEPYDDQAQDITKTATITHGPHPAIKLSGNQILTFKGPGIYTINYIDNKNSNTFLFDFDGKPGNIVLHIHNNATLAKLNVNIINGGDASRIFTEVHGTGLGTGKYAFDLANGSPGGTKARWAGTAWVPFAAINVGSGTGSSEITGALWSGTQVNIQSGVNIFYSPFGDCSPPTITAVDAIECSTENGGNTAIVNLNNYVTLSAGTASFSKNGTAIANPTSFVATTGDVITVTASITPSCSSSDEFSITVNDKQKFGICSPKGGKVYEIISSELTMLQKLYDPANPTVSNEVFNINNTTHKVLIEVFYYNNQLNNVLSALAALGFEYDEDLSDLQGNLTVAGYFTIANLDQLNNVNQNLGMNLIKFARPAFPPVTNVGDATTQGDIVMRSDLVRLGYFNASTGQPLSGSGVKVGILSDSYNSLPGDRAAIDVGNWDLPGAANHPFGQLPMVDVLKEYPTKYGAGKDEGRAMLQIVHDVAPRAELAFRTGALTAPDMAKGMFELKDAGCDIICDDIAYITEPFYTPGVIAQAVNSISDQVSVFTSAGNYGDNAFRGVFNSVPDQLNILPKNEGTLAGRLHAFSGGDTEQTLTVYPGTYTIALQWDDPNFSILTGTQFDLDIYLKDFQGQPLFGFNHDNVTEMVEVLSFSVTTKQTVKLIIAKECEACSDTELINFMYVVFRGELKDSDQNEYFPGSSTIVGHAAAEGAMAVGAILYSNTPEFDFEVPASDPPIVPFTVATFSSVGQPGGAMPAFTAPNGGNTTVDFGAPDIEPDGKPNFYGTSAAAPHAAAVAALAMEAREYYYPTTQPTHLDQSNWGPGSSPYDIKKLLQSTATDMHEPGFDNKSGAGLIRAHSALLTMATPNPEIIEFSWDDNANPGEATFTLTVKGTNLYAESQVLFRGTPVPTTYNEETETLEAIIPPFDNGNPLIQVNNSPISELGTDGGSDQRPLYDIPQPEIFIRAIDVTKKYGEIVPEFEATVYVLAGDEWIAGEDFITAAYPNGITLNDVGLTNEDQPQQDALGRPLMTVEFTSPISTSGSLSNFGRYLITPSHAPTSLAFMELFKYAGTFSSTNNVYTYNQNPTLGLGAVDVQKLPIVIKPNDLTVTYGETIADKLTFQINYDASKIESNADFFATLQGLYAADQNKDALAIVDLPELNGKTLFNDFDLTNYSFMVSGKTLFNAKTLYNGKTLFNVYVPLGSFFDYDSLPDDQVLLYPELNGKTLFNAKTLYNAKSLMNAKTLMNGKTLFNAKTLYNGKTLFNTTEEMLEDDQTPKILVIFGDEELENAEVGDDVIEIPEIELLSINLVSGTSVGEQIVVPGAFINELSFNYDPTYQQGTVTINPLEVTVTADANSKVAGQADPVLTFTSNPVAGTVLANGDTITFSGALTREPGEGPGTYDILQGTLTLSDNYSLLFVPAEFTIGCPAVPMITSFETAIGAGSNKPPKVNRPTGTVAGDLLIVGMMFEKGTNTTPTAPAGWALIRRTNESNNVGMATYYKVAGSSEPSSYTFSLTNGPKWSIGITRITGADPTNPIDVHAGLAGGPSFNADAPSLSTTVCNALVMAFYSNKKDATWTPAAGTTELYDRPNTQQGLTSNMMAYYSQPDAGITGSKTATASISDYWVAQQLAIKPVQHASGSSSGRSADLAMDNTYQEESQSFGDPNSGAHAYPNPVRDRVVVQIDELTEEPSSDDVRILDRVGKSFQVKSAWDDQNKLLEIDFAEMGTGIYFIKVNTISGSKSVRVMKVSE
jgi:hypothetical protein